jgi:phosphatidylethanolamine N-methyltransferase
MGGAAFFGLWLMSNSKLVLALAVISHLSHWWFLSTVERLVMSGLHRQQLKIGTGLTCNAYTAVGYERMGD